MKVHREGSMNKKQLDTKDLHLPKKGRRILVGIPAYNEEIAIGSLIWKLNRLKEKMDFDILVVDDGSHQFDETINIARSMGAIVEVHKDNLGKGAAIRTIMNYAKKKYYHYLVLIDSDGQHDPYEIPHLISGLINPGADITIGTRWGESTEMPFVRKIGKNVLDRFTIGGKGRDTQSGFRALNRKAIRQIQLTHDDFAVESEMLAEAHEKGLKVKNVRISCRYKNIKNANTKGSAKHGVGVLHKLIMMIVERRPLFFFGITGVAFLLASLISGMVAIHIARTENVLSVGYSMLTLIFIILGSLLIISGFILNELKRLFDRHTERDLRKVEEFW